MMCYEDVPHMLDCFVALFFLFQPKNGEPVVRWFVDPNKPLQFNKDFLAKAGSNTSANELKTPDDWPTPEFKCVLRELNLHICCYGGNDFEPKEG